QIASPSEFQEALRRQISRGDGGAADAMAPDQRRGARAWMRRQLARWMPGGLGPLPALRVAGLAIVLAIGAVTVWRALVRPRVVAAQELVSRSDAAVAALVRPGQLLFRHWRVMSTVVDGNGRTIRQTDRAIHEWMDGSDPDRVAGKWFEGDGSLRIA